MIEAENAKKWQGISAGMLKMIAVLVMFIDHTALAVLARLLLTGTGGHEVYVIYKVMRQIGRSAFPIYCYLLVEGLHYSRNKWNYLERLGLFALISEIPFDLAFQSTMLEFGYQNVFFTLAIGLFMLIVIQKIEGRQFFPQNKQLDLLVRSGLILLTAGLGMGAAEILKTDYGLKGIFCIFILYIFRRNRRLQLVAGYLTFLFVVEEPAALPAFLLLALYRGKKGWSCKYFFYAFYPVHLLLLYFLCVAMGIGACPAL